MAYWTRKGCYPTKADAESAKRYTINRLQDKADYERRDPGSIAKVRIGKVGVRSGNEQGPRIRGSYAWCVYVSSDGFSGLGRVKKRKRKRAR